MQATVGKVLTKIFGSRNERLLKRYRKIVEQVNELESQVAAKSDDEHVQIILKGKKGEKPPNMPAYETKGITAEQAKALLDHMKSLRQ